MIIAPWNPSRRRHRTKGFCYRSRFRPLYLSGRTLKVPGPRGMTYTKADWIVDEAISHQFPDEQNARGVIEPAHKPDRNLRNLGTLQMPDPGPQPISCRGQSLHQLFDERAGCRWGYSQVMMN